MDAASEINEIFSDKYGMHGSAPELVFGLVGPLGCNIDAVQQSLKEELQRVGYRSELVHITKHAEDVISTIKLHGMKTYDQKIDLMNNIVQASDNPNFLARIAISKIVSIRLAINKENYSSMSDKHAQLIQSPSTAYIIRQLKRPEEIELLRRVYGRKFIQVSVVVSDQEQYEAALNIVGQENPEKNQVDRENAARRLVQRDRAEAGDFGQKLIGAYHSADVFLGGSFENISAHTARFIQAFFGSNYISPTKDEVGAYLAKAASLRTLDLSRQVGAAITNVSGDIISLGVNEVPRPGGGNYWCDDESPQRDIERGVEANKLETKRVMHDFVYALSKHKSVNLDPKEILNDKEFDGIVKDTLMADITEFGRMTHAEMAALADAARLGRSTQGATMYVTTFPCHNCAKHLVAAGISRIVYIEPYAKSKAFELSGDALSHGRKVDGKVLVQHFVGISPRRYRDIFEKPGKRRDGDRIKKWHYDTPTPMIEDKLTTHTMVEFQVLGNFKETVEAVRDKFVENSA